MPMRRPAARQLRRVRSALGWLSVVSLFATLCLIWTLTGQTPEETTALTKAVAFKVDDATGRDGRGDVVVERDDTLVGVSGASDLTGPAIISQPERREVREGEDVVFSVDALRGRVLPLGVHGRLDRWLVWHNGCGCGRTRAPLRADARPCVDEGLSVPLRGDLPGWYGPDVRRGFVCVPRRHGSGVLVS